MTTATTDFTAGFAAPTVADAYDEILVPRLFAPCAAVLLARLGLHPGETLLDVACGTGVVARMAASVIGPAGQVIARDINEAMLARARVHQQPPDSAPVEFGASPAAPMNSGDGTADAVTCQQGLQFFPDPDAAVAEMARCLRPGGRVGIAVWCGIEECPLWLAFEAGLAELFGSDRASSIRQPFSWPGSEALIAALGAAGFTNIVISAHTVVMHFESGMRLALGALAATPFADHVAGLEEAGRAQLLATATARIESAMTPDDPLRVPARTLVATAVRA